MRGVVAALVIVGACGGAGEGSGEAGGPVSLEGLPGGMVVEAFAAGDDEAWVVGRSGGDGVRLFAAREGGALRTSWSGAPHALGMEAFGGGAVVTNLRCTDGSAAMSAGCDGIEGVATFVGDGGRIDDEVVVWSADRGGSDGDGIALLGVSETAAWVAADGEYLEVVPGEGVVGRLPRIDATLPCVLGGELYALSGYAWRRDVDAAPDAWRRDGGTWAPVGATAGPPGTASSPQPGGPTVTLSAGPHGRGGTETCQRDAIEVNEVGDDARLLGRWTPAGGYVPADPAAGPPHWRPTSVFERRGAFAVDAAGALVERGPDGHYRPTGIELAGFTGPGPMPPLHVDRSAELLVACVGSATGERLACQHRHASELAEGGSGRFTPVG